MIKTEWNPLNAIGKQHRECYWTVHHWMQTTVYEYVLIRKSDSFDGILTIVQFIFCLKHQTKCATSQTRLVFKVDLISGNRNTSYVTVFNITIPIKTFGVLEQ